MSGRMASGPATVSRLVANTKVPSRAVGVFWLGGVTVALKSHANRVYVFDPGFQSLEGGGPVGAIDVRPDLVVCTFHSPSQFNLSSLMNLSTAFPEARFAGSHYAREWMIGRDGSGEVSVSPGRVVTVAPGESLDVRTLGISDRVRLHVLEDASDGPEPWNLLMTFSGIRVCLIRRATEPERLERLCEAMSRRPDLLIWSLEGEQIDRLGESLQRLHARYVLPVGYDRLPGGGDIARRFRDLADGIKGTEAYLFPEDYQEGLIYSRLLKRR
jgi:hypothetical protein